MNRALSLLKRTFEPWPITEVAVALCFFCFATLLQYPFPFLLLAPQDEPPLIDLCCDFQLTLDWPSPWTFWAKMVNKWRCPTQAVYHYIFFSHISGLHNGWFPIDTSVIAARSGLRTRKNEGGRFLASIWFELLSAPPQIPVWLTI